MRHNNVYSILRNCKNRCIYLRRFLGGYRRLLAVISSDCLWGRDWGPEKEGQQLTFSLYILFCFCNSFTMSIYLVKKINSKLKQNKLKHWHRLWEGAGRSGSDSTNTLHWGLLPPLPTLPLILNLATLAICRWHDRQFRKPQSQLWNLSDPRNIYGNFTCKLNVSLRSPATVHTQMQRHPLT